MKKCAHCGQSKVLSEFPKRSSQKDGLNYNCRTCTLQQGKESKYRYRYGIELKDKEQMIKEQENKCAICGRVFPEKCCVDHNHKTGQVRAILCEPCNYGLGHFGDNIEIMERAIEYLKKWNT